MEKMIILSKNGVFLRLEVVGGLVATLGCLPDRLRKIVKNGGINSVHEIGKLQK